MKIKHQVHREAVVLTHPFHCLPLVFLQQDQQRNEELARIMGELEVTDQPRQSASKGDDLLAMMDGL